jgi:hypothetical protein
MPNARLEGLHWRLDPAAQTTDDTTVLRDNLMSNYVYRGYADASVQIEPVSRTMGFQYVQAFKTLIERELAHGRNDACRAALGKFELAFPAARLGLDGLTGDLRGSCG